jgi:hypothetical protein
MLPWANFAATMGWILRTTHMKYGIDYRLLKKGSDRPIDNTTMARPVDVEVDETQFALIPMVGDCVAIEGETDIRNISVRGRVKSRHFNYVLGYCYVTIVIEETDEDWSQIAP